MRARALFAPAGIVEAVEEDGLLGEDQPRGVAREHEFHRRQRDRDAFPAGMHVVGVYEAPIRHYVPVECVERSGSATRKDSVEALSSTHPKVELAQRFLPFRWPHEPAG